MLSIYISLEYNNGQALGSLELENNNWSTSPFERNETCAKWLMYILDKSEENKPKNYKKEVQKPNKPITYIR